MPWKEHLAACFALSLAAGVTAAVRFEDPASAARAQVEPPAALLSDLRARPTARLGERLRLRVQKDAVVEDWTSYLSRFTPARYVALSAWPDEVFTWYSAVYADPATRLFARRGSPAEGALRAAGRYDRLELVGVLREVFAGEPWIEIERVTPLPGRVGEGTILQVGRAIELLRQGSIAMALDQLDRARAAPLPPHALGELERLETAAREAGARAGADSR